jgi:predicted ATPase
MLNIEQIEAACRQSEPVVLADRVATRIQLPLQATFYPLGFPVQVATNSQEVLDSAAQAWAAFGKLFNTEPIQLRVAVTRDGSSRRLPAPVCRVQQQLLSHVADRDNFAICDLAHGFCFLSLTEAAVEDSTYLRFYFLEAAALCQIAARYATPIHGACVELDGSGVLLCGDSGAGKSTLAYACARAGWTYITDDASYVINDRHDRMVVGNSNQARFRPSAADFFSELAGREITRRGEAGKPTIEFSTPPFSDIIRSHISQIEYIVFLNRRDVTRPGLHPFSREVARYFMQQPLLIMLEDLERQDAVIDRLLGAEVLELRYEDLEWAIERLTTLVTERR